MTRENSIETSNGRDAPRVCPRTGKVLDARRPSRLPAGLYALSGLAALAWFLVRVVPKPSRASYPCQRVAMPMASAFVLWLLAITGSAAAFRKARTHARKARYALAGLCAIAGAVAACWALHFPGRDASAAWEPVDPPNTPMGVARGIHPGRVAWVHEPDATSWDGSSSYWWDSKNTNYDLVEQMVSRAIRALAGAPDDAAAWDALFKHFNRTHGRGDVGYQPGEGIAIKINMNVSSSYGSTNGPIASPPVIRALLRQLVGRAGVTESAISVYDAARNINDPIFNLCHPEFPGVQFVDNDGLNGRVKVVKDDSVPVYYSGPGAGASGTSRLPKCVVDSPYLINLALLRGHSLAGVTLCGKNHFGSIWHDTTTAGGWTPENLHTPVNRSRPMGSYSCLVDLAGHRQLGGKTLLYMIDALYAAVNQSSSKPSRWQSSPFNGDWTSSIFASQDWVAIDSVGVDFCRSEPTLTDVTGNVDNYLHEGALAGDPPSGTVYDPENDGTRIESLGVHEHWNNATDKQYSRNLGTGDGIELLAAVEPGGFRRGDANADGDVDISDAVRLLLHLFAGSPQLPCASSGDADDTGVLEMTDALYILRYLFIQGASPPPPFPGCGGDPTPDSLTCEAFAPCR